MQAWNWYHRGFSSSLPALPLKHTVILWYFNTWLDLQLVHNFFNRGFSSFLPALPLKHTVQENSEGLGNTLFTRKWQGCLNNICFNFFTGLFILLPELPLRFTTNMWLHTLLLDKWQDCLNKFSPGYSSFLPALPLSLQYFKVFTM